MEKRYKNCALLGYYAASTAGLSAILRSLHCAETTQRFTRRIYSSPQQMAAAERVSRDMRIVQMRPDINWQQVWRNLHYSWVSEEIRSVWYAVIHDIVPTNTCLAAIKLVETDVCRRCGRTDTLQHRLTEGVDGATIRDGTQKRLALMLRTDPRHIPDEWTPFPQFHF
jgi:hypothetical protein